MRVFTVPLSPSYLKQKLFGFSKFWELIRMLSQTCQLHRIMKVEKGMKNAVDWSLERNTGCMRLGQRSYLLTTHSHCKQFIMAIIFTKNDLQRGNIYK